MQGCLKKELSSRGGLIQRPWFKKAEGMVDFFFFTRNMGG